MKKLFQDPRKAAAVISAAVIGVAALIAVIVFAVKYSGGVQNDTVYLDNLKRNYGASADVVYARDRLDFTEVELPETVGEYTLNYENSFLADSNSIVAELRIGGKQVGTGVYYIKENELRPLYVLEADELDTEKCIFPVYADPDYAVAVSTTEPDDPLKPSSDDGDKVFVFDLHSMQYAAAYFSDSPAKRIGVSHNFVMFDGELYFDIYLVSNKNFFVHTLNFESSRITRFSGAGYDPIVYKNDIVYTGSLFKEYTAAKGVRLPEFSDDPDCEYNEVFARDTVYEFKRTASGEQSLTDLSTGKRIFLFETLDMLSSNKDYISFTASVYDHQSFIYNMSDNEMLVFGQDEQVIIPKWYECGLGLCLGDNNGGKVKAYIVSDKNAALGKTLEYSALPDNVTALDKYRTYISYVPVVSVEDAVEFTPIRERWADDDVFNDSYLNDEYMSDYKPPMINGYAVNFGAAEYFELNGRRSRVVSLCRIDDKESEYDYFGSTVEWGYYDLETRGYTALFTTAEYGELRYLYRMDALDDYLIFAGGSDFICLLVEISSIDSPDGPNIIKIGEGLENVRLNGIVMTDDGTLYFGTCDADGNQRVMYSFRFVTGETVKLAENAVPIFCSAGELFYQEDNSSGDSYIKSLSGKYLFDRYDIHAKTDNGLYGIKNTVIGGAEYKVFYNMLTDENIFAIAVYPEYNVYGFSGLSVYGSDVGMVQLGDGYETLGGKISLIYDSVNNRIAAFDSDKYRIYIGSYDGNLGSVKENGEWIEYEISLK